MDALLSLFDVSLSLSLFLAPQILLDKERKKERKKTAFFFFFFFFFSFPPKQSRTTDDDDVERRFDSSKMRGGCPFLFFSLRP